MRPFPKLHFLGNSRIARLEQTVDRHSTIFQYLEGENGIRIRENAKESLTFSGSGAGGGCKWSGIVWYLGELKWDFSKINCDPAEAASDGGISAALTGKYLHVEIATGNISMGDLPTSSPNEVSSYYVANKLEDGTYVLASGRTVGDIRIELAPYHAPIDGEEE